MKTIQIVTMVDVIGALATRSLEGRLYMVDSNKEGGSQQEGTGALKTCAAEGDGLLWTVRPIDPESFAAISGVDIPKEYCEPEKKYYPDSDIAYWEGKVKQNLSGEVAYSITLELGTTKIQLMSKGPRLIG